jgi:hypothetical protein
MSTATPVSDALRQALENPTNGVAGVVDDLLRACPERGLQLDCQGDRCRVVVHGTNGEEIDVPLRKSVFRALLARLAVLCNQRRPDSVSPYGGDGELAIGEPETVFRVTFVNTADQQKVDLKPVLAASNGSAMLQEPPKPNDAHELAAKVPPSAAGMDGLHDPVDETLSEKIVNEIEMLGEEKAAGFHPPSHSEITPGMRYLHSSRTISQLVTDRNRAVGIYLAVASLLVTASCALVNASPNRERDLIIPLAVMQKWCLPLTFAVLAVLAVLVAFLLIRTRVGLIYEVAKMNALLGLPIGRVQRIGWLSIFTILQTIISLAGGCSTALFVAFVLHLSHEGTITVWPAITSGVAVTVLLLFLYVATVRYITSEKRLQGIGK